MSEREHEVVVYGATGYVGELTAAYLAGSGARVALAGRSAARLDAVAGRLRERHGVDWPVIVADSDDPAALARLASSTAVVATTVGPYARYGLPVVAACAAAGTHYADLTGEVLFVQDAIAASGEAARASGARIVHACGYDSIPSDLAVLLLHEAAAADDAGGLTDVTTVARIKGGFSGGTVDSMRAQMEALEGDPALRRRATDWYALSPDRDAEPSTKQPSDAPAPGRRGPRGEWTAPFVMAPYNTRIVRRSNALLDWAYGRELRYTEVMGLGTGPLAPVLAGGVTAGLAAAMVGMSHRRTRSLLDRVLPKPGQGPSEKAREAGYFTHRTAAATSSGRSYTAVVAGPGDPGYKATAVMLGEAALCLASDDLPDRAGSLTPATAMGDALVARLRAAGHTYEVSPA